MSLRASGPPANPAESPTLLTVPDQLLAADAVATRQPRAGLSVFWRTFFWLALLLLVSSLGWYHLFRKLDYEPRVIENTRQVASLLNFARAALAHSDSIARVALVKTLAVEERIQVTPREPNDRFVPFDNSELERLISAEIRERLGHDAIIARRVNDEPGFWVGFAIEGDSYWLLSDRNRIGPPLGGSGWLLWLTMLTGISLLGAAWLANIINQPLRQLSMATARVRNGDYHASRLDENNRAREIHEVYAGFNRMAEELSRIEQDRAEMLAGISHDLRTPLARLRLETEMSVPDAQAREHMVADIEQVDGIINKFLDYARPDSGKVQWLPLAEVVDAAAQPFLLREDMDVQIKIDPAMRVLGDEVELRRVVSNLLENTRRYGKTPGANIARVRISALAHKEWCILRVRDQGPGVPEAQLPQITRPFYRGDAARTEATGSGLGLSIVQRMVQRMGGWLELRNSDSGGLVALIGLRQAPIKTPAKPEKQ